MPHVCHRCPRYACEYKDSDLSEGIGLAAFCEHFLRFQPCVQEFRELMPTIGAVHGISDQRAVDKWQHFFGVDFVAGKKRVPMPATGKTTLRIYVIGSIFRCSP